MVELNEADLETVVVDGHFCGCAGLNLAAVVMDIQGWFYTSQKKVQLTSLWKTPHTHKNVSIGHNLFIISN